MSNFVWRQIMTGKIFDATETINIVNLINKYLSH